MLATGRAFKIQGAGIQVFPAAAAGIDPAASGSSWADAAWSQVVAGATVTEDVYILGAGWKGSANSSACEWEMEIGTGGSGSEVVSGPCFQGQYPGSSNEQSVRFTAYPVLVTTGTRIAVRLRTSGTANQCRPSDVKLMYCAVKDMVPC